MTQLGQLLAGSLTRAVARNLVRLHIIFVEIASPRGLPGWPAARGQPITPEVLSPTRASSKTTSSEAANREPFESAAEPFVADA